MIGSKKILKAEFEEKTFLEKKYILLDLLSKMPQDNKEVNDLIEIVNIINNNEITGLSEVFDIIIEAIESVENKGVLAVEKMLEKAKKILIEIRKMEEEEKSKIDLEAILAKLYN